jgi:hypothetical protein
MSDDEPVWRTGRHVGHHLYLQKGRRPSDGDEPIGTLFTPELARQAVDAVNAVQRVHRYLDGIEEHCSKERLNVPPWIASADVVKCSKCDEPAVCRCHVKVGGRVAIDKLVCKAHRAEEERLAAFGRAEVEFLPLEESDA